MRSPVSAVISPVRTAPILGHDGATGEHGGRVSAGKPLEHLENLVLQRLRLISERLP